MRQLYLQYHQFCETKDIGTRRRRRLPNYFTTSGKLLLLENNYGFNYITREILRESTTPLQGFDRSVDGAVKAWVKTTIHIRTVYGDQIGITRYIPAFLYPTPPSHTHTSASQHI